MNESDVYGEKFHKSRRIIEEADRKIDEPMEEENDRHRENRSRRTGRKSTCRCGRSKSRRRRRKRIILSHNPFIIFYLEMYFKMPGKHVTEVARLAGKEWVAMPEEDKEKYIRLAENERRRRCGVVKRTYGKC